MPARSGKDTLDPPHAEFRVSEKNSAFSSPYARALFCRLNARSPDVHLTTEDAAIVRASPGSTLKLMAVETVVTHVRISGPAKRLVLIGRLTAVVVPIVLWLAPLPLARPAHEAIAIGSSLIIGWITEALDPALIGLIGCFLFWALGVVPFQTAFSGFVDTTTWFLFGAILFGAMASKSGLARRVAFLIISKGGTSYSRLLVGLILSDFA